MSCISVTTKAPKSCAVSVEYPRMGYVAIGKQETMKVDIYPKKKPALVKIYSVSEGQNGEKLLSPLVTLEGK